MTYEEFLKRLAETKGDWEITNQGWIRRLPRCPVSYLADEAEGHYLKAADGVGLSRDLAQKIARAADKKGQKKIRRDILKACGLDVSR